MPEVRCNLYSNYVCLLCILVYSYYSETENHSEENQFSRMYIELCTIHLSFILSLAEHSQIKFSGAFNFSEQ
jgi:hypothetical protein